ncbi:TPA: hypothetical protein ACY4ZU_004349 [Yersinia enterocolitica]|uniref:hypothetical protein n=1 Tax=Yersinia TaxID=629 RepID=UPI0011A4F728|nr:hypothetical protein [Yersinia mollaretii]EKN3726763.1 hypothetical protein [Yersinia enterocolitica]EKN5161368.1 hypothetical protein [Yersinia enterocolitica]EKN6072920.1 hypothetical protein [Yersinia enterocolitica]ELI8480509.1 hypothetical protein [Yersinia enterocolitica]HDL6602342.1 hypothetical protein [Yersinia enterocolitica]
MYNNNSFFSTISNPHSVVTAIPSSRTYPDFLQQRVDTYSPVISLFSDLVKHSNSSFELLELIRTQGRFEASVRMSLLKIFRRCVCTVLDTEATKKITKISTSSLVESYGHLFKSINQLKEQFLSITQSETYALAVLLGEYDDRGQQGYILSDLFFEWFENNFQNQLCIDGPRGAGRDIELSSVFPDFVGSCPCDFIIRDRTTNRVYAIGFARYDSTRGGSQSDDRTGGNSDKVHKAMNYNLLTNNKFKIIFLSDGPGLTHRDTWHEACVLDGAWDGNVRVSTLKTAQERITLEWLTS